MKLPILMATYETPYVTCLALCTYLDCNKDVYSEFHIGSAVDEKETEKLITDLQLNIPIHKIDQNSHGHILNCLYKEFAADSKYFMTMDSDVEFLQPGYVGEMIKMMDETDHYCVSTHKSKGWQIYYPRVQPFVCLWRNDDTMKRAMKFIGMCPAKQTNKSLYFPEADHYDVAGLISNCMEVCGKTIGVLPGKAVRHFGAASYKNRDDPHMLSHCKSKVLKFMPKDRML